MLFTALMHDALHVPTRNRISQKAKLLNIGVCPAMMVMLFGCAESDSRLLRIDPDYQ